MSRTYSTAGQSRVEQVQPLLNLLAAKTTPPEAYQATMFELGQHLGTAILDKIPDKDTQAYLACTAEDADFLARGILTRLETCALVNGANLWTFGDIHVLFFVQDDCKVTVHHGFSLLPTSELAKISISSAMRFCCFNPKSRIPNRQRRALL